MPLIKRFAGDKIKLKGFITQVKIQINNKGLRLPISIKKKSSICRNVLNRKTIEMVSILFGRNTSKQNYFSQQ